MLEFAIKDCAVGSIATGRRAQTLRELRDVLRDVHPGCIYHHFWGTLLRPQFSSREYNNDLAAWCHDCLHDNTAAERLAVVDPADYADIEELRQELIEIIDARLDETDVVLFTRSDQQFHFVRGVIVVFDTTRRLADPHELPQTLPEMSVGSIFYHFVDARGREPIGVDDFRAWLMGLGPEYGAVIDDIAEIEPYFESLFVLRDRLTELFIRHLGEGKRQPPPSPPREPGRRRESRSGRRTSA